MRISDWSSDVCSSDLYRLQVPFEDAAMLKPQRVTLSNGKTIDLKLPPGIESGRQMRLAGQGEAGPGGNGDALVTIDIRPHPFFPRQAKRRVGKEWVSTVKYRWVPDT